MLILNGVQVNSVILNGVSTTGYLNGSVIWGKSIPIVYIPSGFYFSSNSYIKNQGASGSGTLTSGELFYISGSSTSGIGFDTAFINSAINPTSNYWALGGSSIGMRFTASATVPASGFDMRNMQTGYKVLMFGKTEDTGSWAKVQITHDESATIPCIRKDTVISSTISGTNGYTSLHTAYKSAGSSDTKGFYKTASSNLNMMSWMLQSGSRLVRFSGEISGVRTGTANTYTKTIIYAGNSAIGSSTLPYGETGNFTQNGIYESTLGSAIGALPVSSVISSWPNAFNKYTTAGVAWSAMARVP